MADNDQLAGGNNDDGGDDIFVYMGGEQEVPRDVKRAKIDETLDTIPRDAFQNCTQLIELEGHNKLKKIEREAFQWCYRLRWLMKMNGVIEIEEDAFFNCQDLSELEFGKLEIIGKGAFDSCKSLRSINLPSIRRIGKSAFVDCESFRDAVFGEDLERIEGGVFRGCPFLRCIAIPSKERLIIEDNAFRNCPNLSRVDIVGGIHKTISSLHLQTWRNEMTEEIGRINQTLLEIPHHKTSAIQQWIRSVLNKKEHYKTEHKVLVKEAMVLLELALWKVKLDGEGECNLEEEGKKSKKAKIDINSARKEHRVTCGANIVIKNVLPFLTLE